MPAPRRSVLAVAVLSMLTEEPMHPYRMQQLIKERNKGDIVNVTQRNSVYQTIDRLLRAELVEVESTAREANRPERTTYQITDAGRTTLREWLDAMLRTPAREYPEFPAALSFLPSLSPAEAVDALTARISHLEQQLRALGDEIEQGSTFLARLFLIETEYQQQVLATELDYVKALVDDLRTERITWPAGRRPFTA